MLPVVAHDATEAVTEGFIVIVKVLCASEPTSSRTTIVTDETPDVVGVPEIIPDTALRVSPVGNDPEEIDQEKGDVPPVRVGVHEYGRFTVHPEAQLEVDNTTAPLTVKV